MAQRIWADAGASRQFARPERILLFAIDHASNLRLGTHSKVKKFFDA
jgi:hypothetical protein